MRSVISQLRNTVRLLVKSPGLTLSTIIILGFGLGATAAIFSFINGVLLKPLPYPRPDRLVAFLQTFKSFDSVPLNYADYVDFQAAQHSFENLMVYETNQFTLMGQGEPERISGVYASEHFFSVLGRAFTLGRPFGEAEDKAGRSDVVVISERLWRSRYHADRSVIGENLDLDGRNFQIIGVTPGQADELGRVDLYVPIEMSDDFQRWKAFRGMHYWSCVGRLKPGVTVAQAKADLDVIDQNLATSFPKTNNGLDVRLVPYLDLVVGNSSAVLWLLESAVGCLLAITCANVANLLLARAQNRRKEITLRSALGATRSRLVFQLLAESIVLALLSGAVGLAIAVFAVEAAKTFGPQDLSRFQETTVDGSSLLFLFGITMGTALLFGLLPAWTTSKADLTSSLKEDGDHRGTSGPAHRRGQAWLVGGQVALACLLLMGAGLLTRSFQALQGVPLGFDPGNILTADIFLSGDKYVDQRQCQAFFDTLLEKVRRLPGISAVAINDNLPFKVQTVVGFGASGQAEPASEKDVPFLTPQVVSPDYFRLMKIPLVRGRSFDENDQVGRQKVAIINESIAKRFFPGRDPIGEQIHDRHENRGLPRDYYTIVGVVGDSMHDNPESASVPFQAYYPYTQGSIGPTIVNSATLLLKAAGDPKLTTASLRRVLGSIDPDVALSNVSGLGAVVRNTFLLRQVAMMVVNLFSGVALFLASIGLYAILAYAVARRRREFGIRLALGAPSINILALVIKHGAKVVGIGLLTGTIATLVLFQFLGSLLYGVNATDPLALSVSLLLLSITCFVACLLPALRAIGINPIKALRE